MSTVDPVWRVGHDTDPLGPVPKDHAGWHGRFDDPRREFSTIYLAESRMTAIREVYAPLRPDAEAIAEYRKVFGPGSIPVTGRVSLAEQRNRRLVSARLAMTAPLVDLGDAATRTALANDHAELLASFAVPYLDETDMRTRDRGFTLALARVLYDAGNPGVRYQSNIDGRPCFAVFEDRYDLETDATHTQVALPRQRALRTIGITVVP